MARHNENSGIVDLLCCMRRIEIVRDKNRRGFSRLYLDGEEAKQTWLAYDQGTWSLETTNRRVRDALLASRVGELRKYFWSLALRVNDNCHPLINDCVICFGENGIVLDFGSTCSIDSWRQPYTVGDLCKAIKRLSPSFKRKGMENRTYKENDNYFLTLSFTKRNIDGPLLDEFTRCARVVRQTLHQATDRVHAAIRPSALTLYFRFPKEIQSACAQYLLYFQQFLSDLGIGATAEIKERAHRLLFTVSPTSGKEGLLWVKEALVAYLQLPSLTEPCARMVSSTDVAILQLDSNICHLKQQLEMSRYVIAAQDTTIRLLEHTDFRFREETTLSAPDVPAESAIPGRRDGGDEGEPLVGRFVSVTSFEIKGFKFNLPELLRALKRRWSR